jgi:hypothetical protein
MTNERKNGMNGRIKSSRRGVFESRLLSNGGQGLNEFRHREELSTAAGPAGLLFNMDSEKATSMTN